MGLHLSQSHTLFTDRAPERLCREAPTDDRTERLTVSSDAMSIMDRLEPDAPRSRTGNVPGAHPSGSRGTGVRSLQWKKNQIATAGSHATIL